MTRRARSRWLLLLLVVLPLAACRSESDRRVVDRDHHHDGHVSAHGAEPAHHLSDCAPRDDDTDGAEHHGRPRPASWTGSGFRRPSRTDRSYGSGARVPTAATTSTSGSSSRRRKANRRSPAGSASRTPTSAYAGQQGDGSVDAFVGVNLPPGSYVVQAQCVATEDRSNTPAPPPKVFTPFNITVTGDRRSVHLPLLGPKQWTVVMRGDASASAGSRRGRVLEARWPRPDGACSPRPGSRASGNGPRPRSSPSSR